MDELFVRVQQSYTHFDYDLHLYTRGDGVTKVLHTPVYGEVKPGLTTPTFATLTANACQKLIDDLWAAGFRPTEEPSGEGIKNHLKDMRTLVSKLMEVEL